MNILGFNCFGHDSAASLLVDDRVVFAVEEERLNRRKHYGGFPERSIEACLSFSNLRWSDIDHVVYYWKPSLSYVRIPGYFFSHLSKVPSILKESRSWAMEENLGMIPYWFKIESLPSQMRRMAGRGARFKFHFLEHHLCHAASAFYCSGFEESAILTVDGGGEWTTALLCRGRGNAIEKLRSVDIPHSVGAFYQAVSRYLGFELIAGPGKLMGLSSYGDRDSDFYRKMRKLVRLEPGGGFKLDLDYFAYHYTRARGVSERFEKEFGPPRTKQEPWQTRHHDIAAAAQRVVEDIVIHMARCLHEKVPTDKLAIAGGVGLNSVTNGRLLDETPFKQLFIQPAAGDSGTSLGGTLYLNHAVLGRPRRYVMNDAFLGPGFSEAAIRSELERSGLPWVQRDDIYEVAAKLLEKGKILGWFQGRLEFGPRALGNRSILANPCLPEMKDILNARVKFRESFRPFAPIILEESCGEYFDKTHPSPHMLLVYNVREEKKAVIPSVTHVDGTGRVQTVRRDENPQMHALLTAFRRRTGVPVLLNTSFNVKSEPIVCTPFDAVDSFARADMDYLIMGNTLAGKRPEDLRTEDLQ